MDDYIIPLSNYRIRYLGVLLAAGAGFLIIIKRFNYYFLSPEWNSARHLQVLKIGLCLGLYLIAFSREKVDDERTRVLRGKAFEVAFLIIIAALIGYSVATTGNKFPIVENLNLPLIAAIGLGSYLIVFNHGLNFDSTNSYNGDEVSTNLTKKRFFIVYVGLIVVSIALLL